MRRLWITVVVLCVSAHAQDRESRVVETAQGPVRGYRDPKYDLYSFYGIPYATAPTGRHRFKGPLPPTVREDIFEAVDKSTICLQPLLLESGFPGTEQKEDCLIANIFVPDTEEKNLSVVVYVHGGAFIVGFGNLGSTNNLMKNKNMIVVNFNYRVSIHGFLCLGTQDVPGNAGMKDQVALLRWVKNNIRNFGGNPDDVTIAGYSAGSAAVDVLMISPMAQGLFNKVIPESGSNFSPWTVQVDPIENAKVFAKALNFTDIDNFYALEEFYKTASDDLLVSINFWNAKDNNFRTSVCVEHETGVERFLDDTPLNILKNGRYNKVPVLYGFANMEGMVRLAFFDEWIDKLNNNFAQFLPVNLQFDSNAQKEEIAEKVKQFYFGEHPIGSESLKGFIDYESDIIFVHGHLRSLKYYLAGGHNNVYLYEYSYFENQQHPSLYGSDHCGQSMAVQDGGSMFNHDENDLSDNYKKVKEYMRELWTNFITKGMPVPEGSELPPWPPASTPCSPYMSLNTTMVLKENVVMDRFLFWEDIYEKHYLAPKAPELPKLHSEL